jgi:hypothetical protein
MLAVDGVTVTEVDAEVGGVEGLLEVVETPPPQAASSTAVRSGIDLIVERTASAERIA